MSTPAGWHPQPDGRERYWDGQAWTDQYRTPEPGTPPPPPYQAAPAQQPKKSGMGKGCLISALIIVAVIIIGAVSCIAITGKAVDEVDKSIKAEQTESGGTNNPVTIEEGKAFEIRQFNYADGWTIVDSDLGGVEIRDLKVTNNRDDADAAFVEIKFMKGTEVLESIDCTSDQILVGQTATLTCLPTVEKPTGYDKITINDTF